MGISLSQCSTARRALITSSLSLSLSVCLSLSLTCGGVGERQKIHLCSSHSLCVVNEERCQRRVTMHLVIDLTQ